jgi:hypothetical protein
VLARVATLRPATAQNPAEYVLTAEAAQRVSPYHRYFQSAVRPRRRPRSTAPQAAVRAAARAHAARRLRAAPRSALLASREFATLAQGRAWRSSQRRGAKTLGVFGAALRLLRVALRAVPSADCGPLHALAPLLAAAAAADATREFAPTLDAALDAMPIERHRLELRRRGRRR